MLVGRLRFDLFESRKAGGGRRRRKNGEVGSLGIGSCESSPGAVCRRG